MKEIWKAVPSFEGYYEISNMGRVRSIATWALKRPRIRYLKTARHGQNSYPRLSIRNSRGRAKYERPLHRVVAELFVPGYFVGAEVDHKNDDKQDARASNLKWVTHSENVRRARHRGWKDQKSVTAIHYLIELGIPYRKIAVAFDTSPSHIATIKMRGTKGKL